MHRLAFALYGRRAGVIIREGSRMTLAYDRDYLADSSATPLSLSLPLSNDAHGARPIEAYLRGLLPDNNEVRRRWARKFGLRDRDTLGLLAAIGTDCAGAAVFAPDEELESALGRSGLIEPITEAEIATHLKLLIHDESAWHDQDGDHWSLAGGQSKFTLLKTGKTWARPTGSQPSTHIVKPGISRIPAQAMIEHVSMRALKLLGESVADSAYEEFGGVPAIVVKRFDRVTDDTAVVKKIDKVADDAAVVKKIDRVTDDTAVVKKFDRMTARAPAVTRIHSEDLVQSFGMDPMRKYESDGGPGVAKISGLLRAVADEASVVRFVHATIANYLLGAPDAHAKNYSVLLAQGRATLAPLYDVASGLVSDGADAPVRYRSVAMSIGGQKLIGEVERKEWDRFSAVTGMDAAYVRETVNEMASQMPDAVHDAIDELPKNAAGKDVLTGQILSRVSRLAKRTITGLTKTARKGGRIIAPFVDSL
ncbi:MAG: type II toxin-antitoxin system HipA family toxin [Clostridiales Family XIII bacterium]|jgi:serine/threonine-protein kinase HipA|nr:type II toxin-antitoxin system HipA family toxin [Clostridiales Family XIII bacterium]